MRHSPISSLAVLLLLFQGAIHVAPGDDKPTSNDLGKIRPPGGVPLTLGDPEPRLPWTWEQGERSVWRPHPRKDLDKWVVELERIMDKKLDGWLAKQACRTDFVTRMSVAFDGLKWNAKAADNLFQRARTMPATRSQSLEGSV